MKRAIRWNPRPVAWMRDRRGLPSAATVLTSRSPSSIFPTNGVVADLGATKFGFQACFLVGALMFFSGYMSSEATQTVSIYYVLAWLETNKKSLIIAFVVAVAVGFGSAGYRYSEDQKEFAASDAFL